MYKTVEHHVALHLSDNDVDTLIDAFDQLVLPVPMDSDEGAALDALYGLLYGAFEERVTR